MSGHTNLRRCATALVALAGFAGVAAPASAGTFLCVPQTAGAAVTSGGSTGSCSSGTPVELPSARADQQTLLSVLPYISFSASGIGGKPTITVTGANLQVRKAAQTGDNVSDGTGNLIVGRANNPYNRERSGSENLIAGDAHGWTGVGALLAGYHNQARGVQNVIFGQDGLVSGDRASVLGGYGNTASGLRSSVAGAANKTASGTHEVIADGAADPVATYFIHQDKNGVNVADSGAINGVKPESHYFSDYWRVFRFPGVNPNNCAVTANAVNDPADKWTSEDLKVMTYNAGEMIYVLTYRQSIDNGQIRYTPVNKVDINLVLNCKRS